MRLTAKGPLEFAAIDELNIASFPDDLRARSLALQFAFDNGDVFVEEVCERVWSAFAIVTRQNGQPLLWAIGTRPMCRGRGVASRLLDEIVGYYQFQSREGVAQYEYIDLTVRVDNPAQKLYFDYGWRVKQVLKNYYDGGFDGLRMRRML